MPNSLKVEQIVRIADRESDERAARAKLGKKVARIIQFAEHEAKKTANWQLRSFVDDLQLHYNGYHEPGYNDPECGIIATGNWNSITKYSNGTRIVLSDTPELIGRLFEKLGIPIEWSDEWTSCSHCGRLVRTSPDSMSWKPSYIMGEGEIWCHECDEPDEESDEDDSDDESADTESATDG